MNSIELANLQILIITTDNCNNKQLSLSLSLFLSMYTQRNNVWNKSHP